MTSGISKERFKALSKACAVGLSNVHQLIKQTDWLTTLCYTWHTDLASASFIIIHGSRFNIYLCVGEKPDQGMYLSGF